MEITKDDLKTAFSERGIGYDAGKMFLTLRRISSNRRLKTMEKKWDLKKQLITINEEIARLESEM